MTVINPPGFLQNAGATHTAEQMRNWFGLRGAGMSSATSLIPRGGIHPGFGSELQVTQSGAPAMSVVVKSGMASIPGTESAFQGSYSVMNDADLTVTITAAHATLNRIDRIVFKVEDSAYSGANNISSIVCVTGTPAASPVAPTAPANCITLATVSIVASDTSITNGEITDLRYYYAATGGIITCTSITRPTAGTVNDGQQIYETDTDRILVTNDAGTTWVLASGRMGCSLRRVAAQVLPDAVATNISWDTEDADTDSMFPGAGTNITLPAGGSGVWSISTKVNVTNAATPGIILILVNFAEVARFGFADTFIGSAAVTLPITAGGVIQVQAYADTAAGTNVTASFHAYQVSQ